MTVGRYPQNLMEELSTQLQAQLPAKITAVATARSVTMPAPAAESYVVTQALELSLNFPAIVISMDGNPDPFDWGGGQGDDQTRDLVVPVVIRCMHGQGGYEQEDIDAASLDYAEAIERAIKVIGNANSLSGVWQWRTGTSTYGYWTSDDDSGGMSIVPADFWLRTTQ